MSDHEKELVIADLTAATFNGPGVIFLRPRRPLSEEEEANVMSFCDHMSRMGDCQIRWQHIPHDVDILAAGDVEMERHGWMRIPPAPSVAP